MLFAGKDYTHHSQLILGGYVYGRYLLTLSAETHFDEAMDQMGAPESWTCPECSIAIQKEKEERLRRARAMAAMTSTTFDLPGHAEEVSLGIVREIVVRSRSVLGTVGASLQTIVGVDITLFTKLCEDARRDAFERMLIHAEELGAEAVLGVRYDVTEIAQGVTEVLAYGTAVRLRPVAN